MKRAPHQWQFLGAGVRGEVYRNPSESSETGRIREA